MEPPERMKSGIAQGFLLLRTKTIMDAWRISHSSGVAVRSHHFLSFLVQAKATPSRVLLLRGARHAGVEGATALSQPGATGSPPHSWR